MEREAADSCLSPVFGCAAFSGLRRCQNLLLCHKGISRSDLSEGYMSGKKQLVVGSKSVPLKKMTEYLGTMWERLV